MWPPRSFVGTLFLSIPIAVVHFVVTFTALGAVAFSAISSEKTRVPTVVLERVFDVFSFPIGWLQLGGSLGWLALNSSLCGITLAAVSRWLWSRRNHALG